MNKIRASQAMSSGWNRKERYMLEKDNMMRHIKFLGYWIKTTIPLFTFIITQKDTNSRSRWQLIAFCMRTNNKTNITKNFKEGIIRDIPYNFSKWERLELWENKIVLIKFTIVRTTSPQNLLGTEVDNKREQAVLTMCLCFLSATPFCSGVSVHEVWWKVSYKASNS